MKKFLLTTTLILFSTVLVFGYDDPETHTYSKWKRGEIDGGIALMAGDIVNNASCSVIIKDSGLMFLLTFNSPIILEQSVVTVGEELLPNILWFEFQGGLALRYLGDVEYLLLELIAKAEGNNFFVAPHYSDGGSDYITFNFTEFLELLADT